MFGLPPLNGLPTVPINPMAAKMAGYRSRQGVGSGGRCAPLDGPCHFRPKTATEGLNEEVLPCPLYM
jgi:hypothetical protein